MQGDGGRFHGVNRGGTVRVGNHLNDQNENGTLDGYVLHIMPALRSNDNQSGQAVSQSMVNSPGTFQARRDVIVTSDRRLIQSIQLRIAIDYPTPATQPTEKETDVRMQSAIALFATDKTRIRFVSDWTITHQQVCAGLTRPPALP